MGESLFLMVKSSYVSMGRKQRGYVAEPGTAGLSLDSHVPLLGCWKTMFLLQNPLPLVANHMDIYIYIYSIFSGFPDFFSGNDDQWWTLWVTELGCFLWVQEKPAIAVMARNTSYNIL